MATSNRAVQALMTVVLGVVLALCLSLILRRFFQIDTMVARIVAVSIGVVLAQLFFSLWVKARSR